MLGSSPLTTFLFPVRNAQTLPEVDIPFTTKAQSWAASTCVGAPAPFGAIARTYMLRMLLADDGTSPPAVVAGATDDGADADATPATEDAAAPAGTAADDGAAGTAAAAASSEDAPAAAQEGFAGLVFASVVAREAHLRGSSAPGSAADTALSGAAQVALRAVFDKFDTNGDGRLQGDEYAVAAAALTGVLPPVEAGEAEAKAGGGAEAEGDGGTGAGAGAGDAESEGGDSVSFLSFCSFVVAALASEVGGDGGDADAADAADGDSPVSTVWNAVLEAGFDACLRCHRHSSIEEAIASQEPEVWPTRQDALLVREIDRVEAAVTAMASLTASQVRTRGLAPLAAQGGASGARCCCTCC